MSLLLAAGCALDSFQSVSVVPMIQCRPQGITNSTLCSVRRISPVSSCSRSRGTTRWMPLDARTWKRPRPPASSWVASVQTPVALTTTRARTSNSAPALAVTDAHARYPLALAQEADDLHAGRGRRSIGGGGARDRHGVPGVVDLGVVVLQRPDQAVLAQGRREREGLATREVAVMGEPSLAQVLRVPSGSRVS